MLLLAVWVLAAVASACTGTEGAGTAATTGAASGAGTAVTASATTAPRPTSSVVAPPANTCAPPKPFVPTSDPQTMLSGGRPRPYLLSVPATYDGTTGTPVVLDLHGFTLTKEIQSTLSDLPAKGAAAGMIVVTPDAVGSLRSWNMFQVAQEPDDFAFVADLLTDLDAKLCIDPNRVFSTGISNGSAFSALLACTSPYRFAAIAMVAATVGPTCPPDVRVSVIAFHGTADPVVPYRGGRVNSPAALGRDAPPAEQAMKEWAEHDGCRTTPDEQRPGRTSRLLVFPDCAPGYAVELYRLEGAGHTWPGGLDVQRLGISTYGATNLETSATDLMLTFFHDHPKVR